MFEQLDKNELAEIFYSDIKSPRVKKSIDSLISETEYLNFLEHSISLFWRNKISQNENISEDEIAQLIEYKKYNVYQNVVGELSKKNLLNNTQLKKLLLYIDESDWGYTQSKVRLKLNEIDKNELKEIEIDNEFMDLIFQKKISWALDEIVKYLPINKLQLLYDEIDKKKYFTKTDRHNLLQKIRTIIKEEKK